MIPKKLACLWSIGASFGLVIVLAYYTGGFEVVLPEILSFLSGDINSIKVNHSTFAMMVPIVLAVLALDLPLSIGAGLLQRLILGKTEGEHAMEDLLPSRWFARWPRIGKSVAHLKSSTHEVLVDMVGDRRKEGSLFKHFFILVLIEEVFARELFLGWLHKIPGLNNTVGFYILFFVGNGIWALIHLSNFKLYKDRHPLRVAPQFVSGIFFSYVYLKYGLTEAILTHFGANALLFATHKVQETDEKDFFITAVAGLYAGLSYSCMRKPFSDTMQWFSDNPVFEIPGWEFRDYLCILIFVPTAMASVFGLLLYDRANLNKDKSSSSSISVKSDSAAAGCLGVLIGVAILVVGYVAIMLGVFWIAGFVISDVPTRIIAISVLFSFKHQGASGSAVARTFWTSLPITYVLICALEAQSFWNAVGLVSTAGLILLPWAVIRQADD